MIVVVVAVDSSSSEATDICAAGSIGPFIYFKSDASPSSFVSNFIRSERKLRFCCSRLFLKCSRSTRKEFFFKGMNLRRFQSKRFDYF